MTNDLAAEPKLIEHHQQHNRHERRTERRAYKQRTKQFGFGNARLINHDQRKRLIGRAAILRRTGTDTEDGLHITFSAVEILRVLLFRFYNHKTGACYPCLDTIAKAVGIARSTVQLALAALEGHGLVTWTHRLNRTREFIAGLFPQTATRERVLRSSNSYAFGAIPNSSNTENRSGSRREDLQPLSARAVPTPKAVSQHLTEVLDRLQAAVRGQQEGE